MFPIVGARGNVMQTAAMEILRAFEETADDVLGRKLKRKLIRRMHAFILNQIPDNGVGPVMGARREALQMLDSAVRLCEKRHG